MSDVADALGLALVSGAAAWMEARWERRFGHLRRAEDLARHALELTGGELIPRGRGTTLAGILLDRGDVEAARAAVADAARSGPTASIFGTGRDHAPGSCWPRAGPRRRWRRSTSRTRRTAPAAG